jgi:hypothetical protein
MKKIVLAILVIIMGVKVIADTSTFASKYSIIKLANEDEENKKEKEENKHSKRNNDDIYYADVEVTQLIKVTAMVPSFLNPLKQYSRFIDRPNTPPPDFI